MFSDGILMDFVDANVQTCSYTWMGIQCLVIGSNCECDVYLKF